MDARTNDPAIADSGREIVIERVFDAPAETLWQAITDPGQMRQWYTPQLESFKAETGFETQFTVRHNGKDFVHLWTIMEVDPGRKITYNWRYEGNPGISFVTFALSPEGMRARLKLVHTGLETFRPESNPDLALKDFLDGWNSILSSLLKFTETSPRFIIMDRILDAPCDLVWEAWTNPEHIAQWWGPHGFTNPLCQWHARPGNAISMH